MARTKYSLASNHGLRISRTWQTKAVQFQALSYGICLAMIICFTMSSTGSGAIGTTELFSGQCSHAVNINRVLQAILAFLAIAISVSFDFFMRIASSPTADDLQEAHTQGLSLDIAVHSFRNVRRISPWRTCGWITLILLAVPVQLFSHSIAFISFGMTGYSRFVVSEAFTTGQPFAYPGVALLGSNLNKTSRSQFDEILPIFESAPSTWDRLESSDCKRIYSQDIEGLQSHRNLLVVIENGPEADAKGWIPAQVWNDTKSSTLGENFSTAHDSELENSLWSFATYCEVNRDDAFLNGGYTACMSSYDGSGQSDLSTQDFFTQDPWGAAASRDTSSAPWFSSPYNVSDIRTAFQTPQVKYCLSEPYSTTCKVYASNFFLLITTLCILLGCTGSTLIARLCWHKETCQSLGDALRVFLKDGGAFAQKTSSIPAGCNSEVTQTPCIRWTPVSKWEESKPRWGQAISKRMWLWTYAPICTVLLGGSAALGALGKNISQVPNPLPYK